MTITTLESNQKSIVEVIGNTPLVKLNEVVSTYGADVFAKVEYLNPGGSIKDRIGIFMIRDAERRGLLKDGGTIIEPTSGNTGMGLALVAGERGYKMIFTMPDKMSYEKRRMLKDLGAEVIVTPTAVPADSPANYIEVAKWKLRETPNSWMPNQYYNLNNPLAHYMTTGPEIWKQTRGRVDVFVAGMGTGGTISGVGMFLKEKNPAITVIGVDPEGSIYHHLFEKKQGEAHPYKVEGIGEDFLPGTMDMSILDGVVVVNDQQSFDMARRLRREEELFAGGSAGANVFAAAKVARWFAKGKTVVTVLPDSGDRYLSKFYSDGWMEENGFKV